MNEEKTQCYHCKEFFDDDEISQPEDGEYKDICLCQECLVKALKGLIKLNL